MIETITWLVFALEAAINVITAVIAFAAPDVLLATFGVHTGDGSTTFVMTSAVYEIIRGYGVVLLAIGLIISSALVQHQDWSTPTASLKTMRQARGLWTALLLGDVAQLIVSLQGATLLPRPSIGDGAATAVGLTLVFAWARLTVLALPVKRD